VTVVVDDRLLGQLLRDSPSEAFRHLLAEHDVATTNLYYVRLCRAAYAARGGRITGAWSPTQRAQAARALTRLSPAVQILPMRDLAFHMAELADRYHLSSLGAEAVAAGEAVGALCVSSAEVGPRIKAACQAIGVTFWVVGD
jgi:hypothetical protein